MSMNPMGMMNGSFQTEIIYSFVIILSSLMIYFGTKKLYELSSHKGIKYLREAFLFFAIAYFFRSFIKIFFILTTPRRVMGFSPIPFQTLSLFVFIYFSTMAVFYLTYSIMWKRWKKTKYGIYLFHGLALLVAVISIILNSSKIYLIINLLILALIIFVTYFAYLDSKKHKKKKLNLYGIYILLFIFWILNVIDVLIPRFLQTFQIIIYIFSLGIFLSILYKVLKNSGSN